MSRLTFKCQVVEFRTAKHELRRVSRCRPELAWGRLSIGRDARVSNQLPFGSAMNRHHDVQRETRAHDLVKPLVRLALKSPEHVATLRHAPHAVRPQAEYPVTTDLLLLRPTGQALIQSRGDAVEQVNVLPVLSRQQRFTLAPPFRLA